MVGCSHLPARHTVHIPVPKPIPTSDKSKAEISSLALVTPAPWTLVILDLGLIWGQGIQGVLSFSLSATRREELDSFPFYPKCAFTTPPHTHILSSHTFTCILSHTLTLVHTHPLTYSQAYECSYHTCTVVLWRHGLLTQVFHLVWPQEAVHTEVQFTHPYNGLSTLWAFARIEEVNMWKILSVVASTW